MELSERIIQTLEAEGYDSIDEQQHASDTTLSSVISSGKTTIVVTDGEITVTHSEIVRTLTTLDRITIPAQVPYAILVGPLGCQVVIGEMHST